MNKSCIAKLINPGSLVSIRVENEQTWSLNIVYNCCDEGIDIPLTSDLMKSLLFINTFVEIKFRNVYFEYLIHGSIAKIELCGSPFIRVQKIDIFENKNNRTVPRHDVYLPANLAIDNNNNYFCTVSNISLGGVSFLLDKEVPSDTECEVNIFLNENNTIFCKGKIIRRSPKDLLLEFSMQFTYMNEENSNCLHSYLYSIDNSYDYLRNKYL